MTNSSSINCFMIIAGHCQFLYNVHVFFIMEECQYFSLSLRKTSIFTVDGKLEKHQYTYLTVVSPRNEILHAHILDESKVLVCRFINVRS